MRPLLRSCAVLSCVVLWACAAPVEEEAAWQPSQTEKQAVESQTQAYFRAKDQGRIEQAYSWFSDFLRQQLPYESYQNLTQKFRASAGQVIERKVSKVTWYPNPDFAAAPGIYAAVDFSSKFENIDIHCGYLIWHQQPDGSFLLMREEENSIPRELQSKMDPETLATMIARLGCDRR